MYRSRGHGCCRVGLLTGNRVNGTARVPAAKALADSLVETLEIFGIAMFAVIAAVVALGEQLNEKRMILFGAKDDKRPSN